jgi:hypothetical protein
MSDPHDAGPDVRADEFDLAQFDDTFAATPVDENEFEPVPDGKYRVRIEDVAITKSKRSGQPMLKWKLRILGPEFAGRLLWRHNLFATPENLKWLKRDLLSCGLEIAKLSDLPERRVELLGVEIEVTKRTKGENENVYFNRRVPPGSSGETRHVGSSLTPF